MADTISNLWHNFSEGDEEAFAQFYKVSYNMMYSYGKGMGMSDLIIHDIVQDILLKLYSKPNTVKDISTLRALLLISVKNAYFNQLKKDKNHLGIESLTHFEIEHAINSRSKIDQDEETSLKIKQVLSTLTAREKEVIYLRLYTKWSTMKSVKY